MFPTKKFYIAKDLTLYDSAKTKALANISGYLTQGDEKIKWKLIVNNFVSCIQSHHKNKTIELPNIKKIIENINKFYTDRLNTQLSQYNLALPACIKYFEDFYFLMTNENPSFQLKDHNKLQLIYSINDGINTCETGKNQRFRVAVSDYANDNNWINNQLSNLRYEVLKRIHVDFVASHHINDAMNVHVMNYINKLAAEHELSGVSLVGNVIEDAYFQSMDHAALKEYFNQRYPILLREYEIDSIQNLTKYLVDKIAEIKDLNSDNKKLNWNQEPAVFNTNDGLNLTKELDEFIQKYLPPQTTLDLLGSLDDDYIKFSLKTKPECHAILYKIIQTMLEEERYFLPMTPENFESLIFHTATSKQQLLKLMQFLQNNRDKLDDKSLGSFIDKNKSALRTYPGILFAHVGSNPTWLKHVPLELQQDNDFKRHTIDYLKTSLTTAIAENNADNITNSIDLLLETAKGDLNYLNTIEADIWNNDIFYEKMRSAHGLCAKDMWNAPLPPEFTQYLNPNNVISDIPKKIALKKLINPLSPGIKTVARLAQELTPAILKAVIIYRKEHSYQPLPCCSIQSLDSFAGELTKNGWDLRDGYAAIKQAAINSNYRIDQHGMRLTITDYLVKTNSWLMAMYAHQMNSLYNYANFNQFLLHLKDISLSLGKCLFYLVGCVTLAALSVALIGVLALAIYIDIIDLLALTAPIILAGLSASFSLLAASRVRDNLKIFGSQLLALIISSWYTIIHANLFEKPNQSVDLQIKCEQQIARLELKNDVAAEEKATLLQDLLDHSVKEANLHEGSQEVNLAEQLQTRRLINYAGKSLLLSYADVAATARNKEHFTPKQMAQSSSRYGYFSKNTTTSSVLDNDLKIARSVVYLGRADN